MNSAAVHSAKLIAEFEKQQHEHEEPDPKYPSENSFGASKPGPFGGGASDSDQGDRFISPPHHQKLAGDAFAADNEMNNFDDWNVSYAGVPPPPQPQPPAAHSTDVTTYADAGPSTTGYRPRPLTQFDYPGGWGAQTFSGVGGLTQDSASRIATLQAKLNQRLGPEYLSQRPGPGGGKKLTYIEGWKLVDLANEVFGFNGWSTTIVRLDVDFLDCSPDGTRFNAGVSCVVRVTLRDGAFHEDIGYGSAENARQKHAALEKGKKEAVTDATKRALKNFGKLLGNCTYDHQYSANALKVSNPAPKFDASELHRRPELRPPQPPQPQPPQTMPHAAANVQQPPRPPAHASAPGPVQSVAPPAAIAHSNDATAALAAVPTRTAAPQQPASASNAASNPTTARRPLNGNDVSRSASSEKELLIERKLSEEPSKDQVAERQQRSLLARQAYLERQQAEARKPTTTTTTTVGNTTIDSHPIITSTNGVQRQRSAAAEVEFGSDSFDDGFNDVLATYDETDLGEAEAASHAVEMEIDEAQRRHHSGEDSGEGGGGDVSNGGLHSTYNAADDSGVALVDVSQMQVKQERFKAIEARRSTSPIKQVKMEGVKGGPRRAGSVGRFVSPPPPPPAAAAAAATTRAGEGVQRGNGNWERASIVSAGGGFVNGTNLVMRNGTTSLSAASSRYNGGGSGGGNGVQSAPRRMHSTTLGGMGGVEGAAHHHSSSNKDLMSGRAVGEAVNHGYLPTEAPPRGIKRAGEAIVGENGRGLAPLPPQPKSAASVRQ